MCKPHLLKKIWIQKCDSCNLRVKHFNRFHSYYSTVYLVHNETFTGKKTLSKDLLKHLRNAKSTVIFSKENNIKKATKKKFCQKKEKTHTLYIYNL